MGVFDWWGDRDPIKKSIQYFLRQRVILLGTPIDSSVSETICGQLHELGSKEQSPISFFVNSPGGVVEAGLEIIKAIDDVRVPIHTYSLNHCQAMAAMIIAHGARGFRFARKDSLFQLVPLSGSTESSRETIRLQSLCNSILSKDTGMPLSEVQKVIRYSEAFDGAQALRLGLIDHVVDTPALN